MTNDTTRQDPTPPAPDDDLDLGPLADDEEPQEERGRIGYGRNERLSSWLLGIVLVAVIAAIGIYTALDNGDDDGNDTGSIEVAQSGEPAPDFTMTTFDGETFTLSEHRGQVVVVNFWGSWCEPCKREMPAFQSAWEASGDDVMFVGVGSKRDPEDKAIEFAEEFGVTYPIGRDTEGGTRAAGQITKDYNVSFYPMTFIIDPEGNISSLVVGEMDVEDLSTYIEQARTGEE